MLEQVMSISTQPKNHPSELPEDIHVQDKCHAIQKCQQIEG
jgi:hypothetical protein